MQIILEPGRVEKNYWRDLLAWRDVAVRYKQTAIGVLWAVIDYNDVFILALLSHNIIVASGRFL